jgi:uncharacterized lipoprotein YmbA
MKRTVLIVSCLLILQSACSSQQPIEKRRFTLHPEAVETGMQASPTIALGKIELAPYLRQEGIVIEVDAGEIRYARHNLWAESLSYSVRRYLQVQLRQLLDAPVAMQATDSSDVARTVDVFIHQLHGTESGTISIVATWRVNSTGNESTSVEIEFTAVEKITADGYPALVQGHKLLLDALAKNISTELGT